MAKAVKIVPVHIPRKWIGVLPRTREQINRVFLIPFKYTLPDLSWIKLIK